MRFRRAIAAPLLAAALALSAAVPASAASTPVVTSNGGWSAFAREPARIYFGNGGAPYITHLRWKAWGDDSAFAEGHLWVAAAGCTAAYACTYREHWVNVWLNRPRSHGGREYFTRMDAEFYHDGKVRLQRLTLSKRGYWDGPLRWPSF